MVFAREEGYALGYSVVTPEAQLLALIREREGKGALALQALGLDLDELTEKIKTRLNENPPNLGEIKSRHSQGARDMFNYALASSRLMGANHVGSGHLLLGILMTRFGRDLLRELHLSLVSVKDQVAQLSSAE